MASRNLRVFNPSYQTRIAHEGAPETVVVVKEGPQGPPGPSGSAADRFTHFQSTPAATWIITHNRGLFVEPRVFLTDAPTVPVYPDYVCPDEDHTTIIFPEPATGRAEF